MGAPDDVLALNLLHKKAAVQELEQTCLDLEVSVEARVKLLDKTRGQLRNAKQELDAAERALVIGKGISTV